MPVLQSLWLDNFPSSVEGRHHLFRQTALVQIDEILFDVGSRGGANQYCVSELLLECRMMRHPSQRNLCQGQVVLLGRWLYMI